MESLSAPVPVEMIEISRRFGGVTALDRVGFSIRSAEVHCLAGENGCGKSTLIKILSGVLAPDSGQIILAGNPHPRLSPTSSQAAGIQVIYQDLALFPNLTVAENIGFHRHLRAPWKMKNMSAMRSDAKTAMDRLNIALPLEETVQNLPIASRQLVAICRSLAAAARIIVMDEPTASLTHREADSLLATVRVLQKQGVATVLVSHRLDDMMAIGERVTVLRDGRNVGTFQLDAINRDQLGVMISGKDRARSAKKHFQGETSAVLEVSHLSREGEYRDISLSVRPGEILGVAGRLGSGRTELALSLFGITAPDTGKIQIDGKPVQFRSNREAIEMGIAYVSEDRLSLGLIMPQSIAENTVVSILHRLCGKLGLINSARRDQTIAHWITRLQIKTPTAARPVRELSGGNQQRVVLAKWLATKPRILILDSPTVGIDVGAKAGLFEAIDQLAAQGLAIILISDEAEELLEQAHRILIMLEGQITAEFVAEDFTEKQLHEALRA